MLILTSQMLLKSWRGNRRNGIVRVMGMSAKEGVIWFQGFGFNFETFFAKPFYFTITVVYGLGFKGFNLN